MDARCEKLLRDKLNAKNFELRLKIEVSQKGRTFCSKRGINVQNGTIQQIAQMFNYFKSTYGS
jgi:hypothetical protein